MELLYLLESLRLPGLNECMLLITRLGEETAFLVIALIVYWCVDKKQGHYLMAVGFAGTMINQFLKLWFRVPRPWVLDPNFTILEQAREAASGYSFPSGHTQMAVGTFGALACTAGKRGLRWLFIAIAVLVPFSRMYIGVHTPADVFTSAAIALVLVFALRPLAADSGKLGITLAALGVLALGLLTFVERYPWMEEVDGHNLESGMKNAYTMAGCIAAMAVVYYGEKAWVRFEPRAPLGVQVVKVLLGLALVLAVKEGLRSPLEAVFGLYPGRMVRYFLIVVTAGLVWPMIFSKMRAKK